MLNDASIFIALKMDDDGFTPHYRQKADQKKE